MVTWEELIKTYSGKKVFLTGHTGFKGSWMLKTFSLLGAEVYGYALPPYTDQDLYHLIDGESLCHSTLADIRDSNKLRHSLTQFQPDFVFHLAAQPLVRRSYEIPAETFEVNAIGTANLLDGVRELEKPCTLVLITTDKVYHNEEWVHPYRETDRLGGYDPYSASKACTELIIDSYRNSFFNLNEINKHQKGIAVARAGNVIGGGDWSKDRLIPDLARAFGTNKKLLIRNPNSIRPWQHVLEPIFGYLMLGQHLQGNLVKFSTPFNFGPEVSDSFSVRQMVRLAIEVWGKGDYEEIVSSHEPHEAGLLKLDISRVKDLLNWEPKLSAKDAISTTLDWYKAYYGGANMNEFTNGQIISFLDNSK